MRETLYARYSVSGTLRSGPYYPIFGYPTYSVLLKLYYVMKIHFSKSLCFIKKTSQHVREWSKLPTTFICLHFNCLLLCVHSVYWLHFVYMFTASCFIVLSLLASFTRLQLCFILLMEVTNFSWSNFLRSLTCQKETEREWVFHRTKTQILTNSRQKRNYAKNVRRTSRCLCCWWWLEGRKKRNWRVVFCQNLK
jgi:hypothetical protein